MSYFPPWRLAQSEVATLDERTWVAGIILTAVAYGIVFILFILTFKQLIRTTTKYNYAQKLPFIIYTTLMLILGTLFVGSIAKITELAIIDYRLFSGAPAAFEGLESSSPIGKFSNGTFVIANWLADGMLIYRYLVIFRSTRRFPLWVVMLIPVLAYMTSFSLSIVWLIHVSAPASSLSNMSSAINFTAPYYWMSLFLNISLTIAICARLLFYRRRVASVLGPNHGTQYTSVAAILVESASLYSAFTLLFFVLFAINNPLQNTFMHLWGEIQIIAALLITYRVAYGAAWVSETSQTILCTRESKDSLDQVQVEFPGSHERPLNYSYKSDKGRGDEMEKFAV